MQLLTGDWWLQDQLWPHRFPLLCFLSGRKQRSRHISVPHRCECFRKHWLPRWLSGKESACQCRRCKRCKFKPWVGKIPWRRKWQPAPVFCLGNHMDRGIWRATVHGATESDMTEQLSTHAPMQGNSVCATDNISSDSRNFHLSNPTKDQLIQRGSVEGQCWSLSDWLVLLITLAASSGSLHKVLSSWADPCQPY